MLVLSKTLDPSDFDQLQPELLVVDQHFTQASAQHPMRRWEYAMALRALDTWLETRHGLGTAGAVVDVGGAGSPFHLMIGESAIVVDPAEADRQTLADYLQLAPRLSEAVFCLSVLEHIPDPDRFCYHLSCLVAPGGLLFLTMDYCDGESAEPYGWPVDRYHFSWIRQRIFNRTQYQQLRQLFSHYSFRALGDEIDWDWHGPQIYGYTFASLALVKRA